MAGWLSGYPGHQKPPENAPEGLLAAFWCNIVSSVQNAAESRGPDVRRIATRVPPVRGGAPGPRVGALASARRAACAVVERTGGDQNKRAGVLGPSDAPLPLVHVSGQLWRGLSDKGILKPNVRRGLPRFGAFVRLGLTCIY